MSHVKIELEIETSFLTVEANQHKPNIEKWLYSVYCCTYVSVRVHVLVYMAWCSNPQDIFDTKNDLYL